MYSFLLIPHSSRYVPFLFTEIADFGSTYKNRTFICFVSQASVLSAFMARRMKAPICSSLNISYS